MSILIENTLNEVKYAGGINTALPIVSTSTLTVNGITNTGTSVGNKISIQASGGATRTLTAANSGSLNLLDAATGVTYTLPAPSVGLVYRFLVTTSVTSNNHKVITDAGTTLILGGVTMIEAADTNSGLAALFNGTTHVSILMNGTTTGGLIGTYFELYCVSATQWAIQGIVAGSGTLATCASTS